ncbi:acyl carrier protein [Streptomyces sp. NPDC059985]|uniref:acyl carrier protein n=1 Tax=Streptomyces sp. NPDC059985 TaxID=3347025 RepID=UPI0036BDB19D
MTERTVAEFGTESLRGLMVELFEFPDEMLTPTTTLDDLGLDSLALMELGTVLEERTGAEVGARLVDLSGSATLEQVARTIAGFPAR